MKPRTHVAAQCLLWIATCMASIAAPPLTPGQAQLLEHVRTASLAYASRLPNFLCTQITHRRMEKRIGFGSKTDVIEQRLSYVGQHETYQLVTVNGKPPSASDLSEISGTVSGGEFGTLLVEIFDPQSAATFDWLPEIEIHGRRAYVFAFHVPAEHGASVTHRESMQEITAAFGGEIAVDAQTLDVLRIHSVIELPKTFPVRSSEVTIEYKAVEIAGNHYDLPVHSALLVTDERYSYNNQIDFRSYHHFGTESRIILDDPGDAPEPPKPEPPK